MSHKNILLVFTDQQRFDTIEALGNRLIRTPALNSLVERGTSFTKAYTPCPVCVPARYAMLTGQLPHRTDCVINEAMPENNRSIMQILSDQGYQTHGVGKMHFTLPKQGPEALWGFTSRHVSEEGGGQDDFLQYIHGHGYNHVHDPHGVRSDMYYIPQPSQLPAHLHNTTWVIDRSIDFLQNRDQDRPFFLMTSFIKPHPPFESPTPWNKLYRGPEMPLPKRPQDTENLQCFWNRFQNRYKYRDQGIDDNLVRTMKAAYYSSISFIDYNLQRLLHYLEQTGLRHNTLVLFTADHGELLGDYDSFGKRCFLDSAARIPLLVAGPDVPPGSTCDTPVSLVDILPTCLDYADIPTQPQSSGESLYAVTAHTTGRQMVVGQYHRGEHAMYMAVTNRHKYIYSAPDDREWLFDHHSDPDETRNRAQNPMFNAITTELRDNLQAFFRQEGYDLPLDGDGWQRYPKQEMPDDADAGLLFQDPPMSLPAIQGYQRSPSTHRPEPLVPGF